MAPRKNTQGTEDSLKGGSPDKAEGPIPAAGSDTSQQPTGGNDDGTSGVAAGSDQDAARATLLAAVSGLDADPASILPQGSDLLPARRLATAVSRIDHDGQVYAPGEAVPVTHAEFIALEKAGAVAGDDWDELPNEILEVARLPHPPAA